MGAPSRCLWNGFLVWWRPLRGSEKSGSLAHAAPEGEGCRTLSDFMQRNLELMRYAIENELLDS